MLFPERSCRDTPKPVQRKGKAKKRKEPPTTLVGRMLEMTGLTQEAFGEAIGITNTPREQVARWEGGRGLSARRLLAIQRRFPEEYRKITGGIESGSAPHGSVSHGATPRTDDGTGVYIVRTADGQVIAEAIDEIQDKTLRRAARREAEAAIERVLENPLEPGVAR